MKYTGKSVIHTCAAAVVVVAVTAACSGSAAEPPTDAEPPATEEAPILGDFDLGGLVAPESVHAGEPFDVQVPDGQDRATYYSLYAQSDSQWQLQQLLFIGQNQDPPAASRWKPDTNVALIGLGGPGPDRIATLEETAPGSHLLCNEFVEQRSTVCTELNVSAL